MLKVWPAPPSTLFPLAVKLLTPIQAVQGYVQMRISRVMVVLSWFLLSGCPARGEHPRDESPDLAALARGLEEVWPHPTREVQMTISVGGTAGHEILHCRLTNTSANVLQLDRSALPWMTPGLFSIAVVTAQGLMPRNPVIMSLQMEPQSISIAAGENLEGDVDLTHVPTGPLPRDKDVLLVWSHALTIGDRSEGVRVNGITFLPRL